MTNKQQAFLELFRAYMRAVGSEKPLFDFIDKLQASDLADCTQAYFDEDTYQQQRKRSLAVFIRLASDAINKDVYLALHVEVQTQLRGSPWQAHYAEVGGHEKNQLTRELERAKRVLTRSQREFIEKFTGYMNVPRRVSQQQIQKFSDGVKRPEDLQGCLRVYIEVSQSYPKGNERDSLLIFFGLSAVALHSGGFAYAHQYEATIKEPGTVWKLRFDSLLPYQKQQLNERIESAKTIRGDVAVEDPTRQRTNLYRDAPMGKTQMQASPIDKVHPEDVPSESLSTTQKDFIAVYRAYVDSKGERKRMDELQTFLRKHDGDDVRACVIAFLQDSSRHYPGQPSHESSQVFFGVLAEALLKNSAYYAAKVRILLDTQGSIWNQRYLALDKRQYRDRLDARIADEVNAKLRVIDEVKTAYFLKFQKDPTIDQLRAFDPISSPELETQLSKALSDCEVAASVKSIDAFDKAFKALGDILNSQTDRLTLVLLVKRCLERMSMNSRYRHLIYLYGVGLIFIQAVRKFPTRYYRVGFNGEEKQWLLEGPDATDRYFSDFAIQLEYAIWKNQGSEALYAMARGQALLQIYADQLRLNLTPLLEAGTLRGAVETAWDKKSKEVSAIRIHVATPTTGHQQLTIGQTIGNFYILWWDSQHSTAYLQVNGLEQVVFEVGIERLSQLYADDSYYGELIRNTQHLLELIPFFFEILGFIPDLVSGGITGLIKSIVFSYVFDKSMQALGIDPTKAQLVLLGVSLLAHGVHAKMSGTKPPVDVGGLELDSVVHDVHAGGTANTLTEAPLIENAANDVPNFNKGTETPLLETGSSIGGEPHVETPTTMSDEVTRVGDSAARKTEAPLVESPLASREGVDMRGPEIGDGQHGVGMHENTEPEVEGGSSAHEESPTTPLEGNQEREGIHADDPAKERKFSQKDRGTGAKGKDDRIAAKKPPKKTKGGKAPQDSSERELLNADDESGGDHKERSDSSQDKDRSRTKEPEPAANPPVANAPPPPLPPPEGMTPVRERMAGTWRQEGRLHVNENGYALKEPVRPAGSETVQPSKVSQARVHGPTYERACDQQVFPDMAENLSDKPVRIDEKNQASGYRSASSSKTSRLKLQKGMQSEGFKRTPDGSMEVVQTVNGKPTVVENNLFEATIDPNFSSPTSRKRVQSSATTWLASQKSGPRYTQNTRINYHIVAPAAPNAGAINILNGLAAANPNLEIFWYVVR